MLQMESLITIVLILVAVFLFVRTIRPPKGVNQVTTEQLDQDLKQNKNKKQWIDVRTPGEFQSRHIKGFKNYPLQKLKQDLSELDQNKEVVVICQSGARSLAAARTLKKNGFEVTNVQGGMNAWKK